MDIIIYEGPHMEVTALEQLARSAAPLLLQEDETNMRFRTCTTREELAVQVRELALREAEDRDQFFPFRANGGTRLLKLSHVSYFKSSGHRIIAVLTDGTEVVGRTLRVSISSLLEPLVASGKFYRTFRSTFVNKLHIAAMGPSWVRLDDGTVLSMSRKYHTALLKEDG